MFGSPVWLGFKMMVRYELRIGNPYDFFVIAIPRLLVSRCQFTDELIGFLMGDLNLYSCVESV